jgi:hypothetical protein
VPRAVPSRRWPAGLAAALSAGSLVLCLASCGTAARAAPAAARAAVTSPTAARAAAPSWRIAATQPNVAAVDGLSASGTNNAWLAETICPGAKCSDQTVITDPAGAQLRWNGTAWRPVALPKAYALGEVVAASPVSNWIVGAFSVGKYATRNVILHWTGKGPGTTTPLTVNFGAGAGVAPTAKDAWLFGVNPDGNAYALHYDGKAWKSGAVPFAGQGSSASSPANVWVSGYSVGDDGAGVMAFNGAKWRSVPLPPLPSSLVYSGSGNIAAASPQSVWLEIEQTSDVADSTPYLLHWTGSKWTSIKIPYGLNDMGGAPIAQDGQGGVWLSLADISNPADQKSYLLHYRSGRWTRVPVPTTSGYRVIGQVALSWIPGTRSLWGAAEEFNVKLPKSNPKLLILTYGG